jgi:ABC-2 type transport system ATP-binding protein
MLRFPRSTPADWSKRLVKRAVDGIDPDVPRGMIFAILGPNGAGKTTLMRIVTLARPDAGTARVMDFDIAASPVRCAPRSP